LDDDHARHIEYGYAVESAHRVAVDRVLITGDASQLAQQQDALARLSPHTRDLSLYTSDSRELAVDKAIPSTEVGLSKEVSSSSFSQAPSMPEIQVEEFGIGL
jgi:hypothetical protein